MNGQGTDSMETGGTTGQDGIENMLAPGHTLDAQSEEESSAIEFLDTGCGECTGQAHDGTAELNAKVSGLEKSIAEERDKYARLLADYDNSRKRSAKEVQLGVEKAERQILLEVLQVMDSFRRCLASNYASVEDFRAGVGLIERQFDAALRRLRVSEIEIGPGGEFDTHVAEALATVKVAGFPSGSIVEVCEKGYRIGEMLLRPARVVVAAGDDAP